MSNLDLHPYAVSDLGTVDTTALYRKLGNLYPLITYDVEALKRYYYYCYPGDAEQGIASAEFYPSVRDDYYRTEIQFEVVFTLADGSRVKGDFDIDDLYTDYRYQLLPLTIDWVHLEAV